MVDANRIKKLQEVVKLKLLKESTGHDWEHTNRVHMWSVEIAKGETGVDQFILEACALLHDVADHKFIPDAEERKEIISGILSEAEIFGDYLDEIVDIIESISFKGGENEHKSNRIESKIIQDADRLDAIGAIGIARTFAYGGAAGRAIFDTGSNGEDSIAHFYDKLLKLGAMMNTQTGKAVAIKRHEFLLQYLKQFFSEWFGELDGAKYFEESLRYRGEKERE